ncbi:MAG: TetR/AcrR family transcriptional regulator [Alphaproteobacteria bacterium]|nr:TetR/AcrR family transcriptional regulator [Alphaproteobacteria bacterium]
MSPEQIDTKQSLICAATRLMWQNSYNLVSVDDICAEADVRKGSFYHHFKSKADLAVSLMEHHYQEYESIMDEIFDVSRGPQERFKAFAEKVFEIQSEKKKESGCVFGSLFVTLGLEMASEEQAVREKAAEILNRYQNYYATAIRDMVAANEIDKDTDIEEVASTIHSFIVGQLILARINNSLDTILEQIKSGIFRIIPS